MRKITVFYGAFIMSFVNNSVYESYRVKDRYVDCC